MPDNRHGGCRFDGPGCIPYDGIHRVRAVTPFSPDVPHPADWLDLRDHLLLPPAAEPHAHLDKALSTLRPEQRDVVVLAYFKGLTHTEIAKQLDQPLGTVKTRMRLAIKKLRGVMSPRAREWAENGL